MSDNHESDQAQDPSRRKFLGRVVAAVGLGGLGLGVKMAQEMPPAYAQDNTNDNRSEPHDASGTSQTKVVETPQPAASFYAKTPEGTPIVRSEPTTGIKSEKNPNAATFNTVEPGGQSVSTPPSKANR